jgi:hypothetical protein
MSRLTVLQTIHDKYFKKWISHYYEDYYYSNILYQDINIRIFFNGLFYRLKLPTNYFIFKRLSYKLFIIYGDIMFLSNTLIGVHALQYKEQKNLMLFLIKHYRFVISYFMLTIFNYSYKNKYKIKKQLKVIEDDNYLKSYFFKKRYKYIKNYKFKRKKILLLRKIKNKRLHPIIKKYYIKKIKNNTKRIRFNIKKKFVILKRKFKFQKHIKNIKIFKKENKKINKKLKRYISKKLFNKILLIRNKKKIYNIKKNKFLLNKKYKYYTIFNKKNINFKTLKKIYIINNILIKTHLCKILLFNRKTKLKKKRFNKISWKLVKKGGYYIFNNNAKLKYYQWYRYNVWKMFKLQLLHYLKKVKVKEFNIDGLNFVKGKEIRRYYYFKHRKSFSNTAFMYVRKMKIKNKSLRKKFSYKHIFLQFQKKKRAKEIYYSKQSSTFINNKKKFDSIFDKHKLNKKKLNNIKRSNNNNNNNKNKFNKFNKLKLNTLYLKNKKRKKLKSFSFYNLLKLLYIKKNKIKINDNILTKIKSKIKLKFKIKNGIKNKLLYRLNLILKLSSFYYYNTQKDYLISKLYNLNLKKTLQRKILKLNFKKIKLFKFKKIKKKYLIFSNIKTYFLKKLKLKYNFNFFNFLKFKQFKLNLYLKQRFNYIYNIKSEIYMFNIIYNLYTYKLYIPLNFIRIIINHPLNLKITNNLFSFISYRTHNINIIFKNNNITYYYLKNKLIWLLKYNYDLKWIYLFNIILFKNTINNKIFLFSLFLNLWYLNLFKYNIQNKLNILYKYLIIQKLLLHFLNN